MNVDSPSTATETPPRTPEPRASTSASPPAPETEAERAIRAAKVKEEGNKAFLSKRYEDAIDLYTEAIGKFISCSKFQPNSSNSDRCVIELKPTEPAYLTNRAASYMALKKFRLALEDCQQAATLQAASPVPRTLIRLARCHLALGSPTPALSTLRAVVAIEPKNAAALQLQEKVLELEAHLRNLESSRSKKDWPMARLALGKCLQGIEGEGGEIPTQWRLWRVELELVRGNLDAAGIAAK